MSHDQEALLTLLKHICETPAPTFQEEARGKLILQLWQEAKLDPQIDAIGNVLARVPGGQGPRVLLLAHLDTVFPLETEIEVRAQGERLYAPGIGDNSASLAILTRLLQTLEAPYPRLMVAANVGEEGLGDLRGVRQLMHDYATELDMVIALDGHLGTIVHQGVGSKRFQVSLKAQGGHSWGDFPSPSAVHALGDMIAALNKMPIPKEARSTYNIGQICGGQSINSIAEEATFNLDLRSVDATALATLEREALARIASVARRHRVEHSVEPVGDRPTAKVDNRHLVGLAKGVLQQHELSHRVAASSTDANAAMASGLAAIAFGLYHGGDAHKLEEWLEPASLLTGLAVLRDLLIVLSEVPSN